MWNAFESIVWGIAAMLLSGYMFYHSENYLAVIPVGIAVFFVLVRSWINKPANVTINNHVPGLPNG